MSSARVGPLLNFLTSLVIVACGGASGGDPSAVTEAMGPWNRPENLPGASAPLEYRLGALPQSGGSAQPVWSGEWWPYSAGGVARRPSPHDPSPLEKYDAVTNGQGLATGWELEQVRRLGGYAWAGHCNGLAAAGTMTKAPERGVNYRNVYFSPDDIRALLVEIWQGGGHLVGGRCDRRSAPTDATGRFVAPECRDLNAGTFHVNLGNFLGRFQTAIILDVTSLEEVWNFPAVDYQVLDRRRLNAYDANRYIGASGGRYLFNDEAAAHVYFKTRVTLATGEVKHYEYLVETDQQDRIVGGEWVGNSKYDHPDFMWRHTTPRPDNPHVDPRIVGEIHALSL
jgi:hypothetical protein